MNWKDFTAEATRHWCGGEDADNKVVSVLEKYRDEIDKIYDDYGNADHQKRLKFAWLKYQREK